MANFCPSCATAVDTGMRACPQCGTTLPAVAGARTATGAPPASPAYAAPRGWTPALTRSYPKASFGSRFLAALIDSLLTVVAVAPGALIMALGSASGRTSGLAIVGILLMAAGGLWALWYSFTKDGMEGGAGYGKRRLGLMVVHVDENRPCTNGESAIRALVWGVVSLVPFIGWLIEPLAALTDDRGRRLGDKAAGTQVIEVGVYQP